ncbi:MAG TPA: SDR family NAD(P)-dependent oxidoreductase [Blastocatellia bacterium]|nr:SDR family NAD(P)-dependent oxidoreductase [Blastocatellia bacterium]
MILKNKVAVVTGGGRGIGRAIAERFVKEGASVAICSRSLKNLTETAQSLGLKGYKILPLTCDIRDAGEVDKTISEIVKKLGGIDILVNNSGASGMNPLDNPDDTRWVDIINTNLTGMYLVTKRALREMKDHNGGRVINISSVLGKFGVPGYTAYCTSKHGVIGFTRALAQELAPRGITANAICPGWVDTEMATEGIMEISSHIGVSPEDFKKDALSRVPLGRFLDPEEVADLALYISSDAAKSMTGQALNLCGGATTA